MLHSFVRPDRCVEARCSYYRRPRAKGTLTRLAPPFAGPHIEAVAAAINLLLTGATMRADRTKPDGKTAKSTAKRVKNLATGAIDPAPLESMLGSSYPYHFLASGQGAMPFDSMGNAWNGSYVTATGNLKMDLLHNFFLECGARAGKMRVYEMTADPTARAMIGYLLVRGGVHIVFES